jgi:hypothetical protein
MLIINFEREKIWRWTKHIPWTCNCNNIEILIKKMHVIKSTSNNYVKKTRIERKTIYIYACLAPCTPPTAGNHIHGLGYMCGIQGARHSTVLIRSIIKPLFRPPNSSERKAPKDMSQEFGPTNERKRLARCWWVCTRHMKLRRWGNYHHYWRQRKRS